METIFDHLNDEDKDTWMAWALDKVRQEKLTFPDLSDDEKLEITRFLLLNYGSAIAYVDDDIEWQFIYGTGDYEHRFKRSVQRAVTLAAVTITEKLIVEATKKMKRIN